MSGLLNIGKLAFSLSSDPFDIKERFIKTHAQHYARALKEIKSGRKQSCWMWYIIPTPPYVVDGREQTSETSRRYALRDPQPNHHQGFKAAVAYLFFPETGGICLRKNYIEIMTAVGDQLEKGVSGLALMGCLDEPKLRASAQLFEAVSREGADPEVNAVCRRVLGFLKQDFM